MERIKNYSLKEFLKLPSHKVANYLPLLEVVNPSPNFIKKRKKYGVEKSLTELTFGEVNSIKSLLSSGDIQDVIEAIKMVYKIKNVYKLNIFQFYGCFNFLIAEIKKINQVEAERYAIEPTKYDVYLEMAGAKELNKFAELSVLDTLANGNILLFQEIEKQPYTMVHYLLWYRATKENINIRFQELIEKKQI